MIPRILFTVLPLLASAAPAPESDFIHTLSRRQNAIPATTQCDVSAIKMNSLGLSAPSPGLVLDHIAIGRGTQNYTCADDLDTTKPVATGALAILYNVTCMFGPYTGLLDAIPGIAVEYPIPTEDSILNSTAKDLLLGHHYFVNGTTPFFNLNTPVAQYGIAAMAKTDATDSKTDPAKNVQNLKLSQKSRDGCHLQEVYRLNCVGGQPPKTCKGMPKTLQIDYAAEYWFWSDPTGSVRTGSYSAS